MSILWCNVYLLLNVSKLTPSLLYTHKYHWLSSLHSFFGVVSRTAQNTNVIQNTLSTFVYVSRDIIRSFIPRP